MKKLFMGMLLACFSGLAQQPTDPFELPTKTVPSPQAFEMTKYGNVPVSEISGRINLSIPIYTYEVGDIKLPIGLSYAGAGVKVDQTTTWTGINWTLQAGGVITRTVNDGPDEDPNFNRVFLTDIDLNAMDLQNGSDDTYLLNWHLKPEYNAPSDTEMDIFHFSFMGNSGSFYLDENAQPTLTESSSNLKIEITGGTLNSLFTNKEFVITDTSGTKYFFGGVNGTEDTQTRGNQTLQLLTHRATTGYYLKRILSYLGDEILFEYESIPLQNIVLSHSETKTQLIPFYEVYTCGGELDGACQCHNYSSDLIGTSLSQSFNRISDGKFLSRIYNTKDNVEVILNSGYTNNSLVSVKILNGIEIKENTTTLYKASLEYETPGGLSSCDRFFLDKVTLYDQNGVAHNKKQVYEMDYNNPEALPARFSYDQDHLGYYNKKNNGASNGTSLPKVPENSPFAGSNDVLADKTPIFENASKGVLKKVTYPTGGYTQFEYESHKKEMPITEEKRLTVYSNHAVQGDDLINSVTIGNSGVSLPGEPISSGVPETQDVMVKFVVTAPGEQPYNDPNFPAYNYDPQNRDFIRFKVTDLTTNIVKYAEIVDDEFNRINLCCFNDSNSNIREFPFTLIKDHSYTFELELFSINGDLPITYVQVEAWFDYMKGYEYVEDLGVRIKRISDYTADGENPTNIKRYYYKKAGEFQESLVNNFNPGYTYKTLFADPCNIGEGINCLWNYWGLDHLSSSSLTNIYLNSENTAFYKYVTISYGGDNFEKGGTQKEFDIVMDNGVQSYHNPLYLFNPIRKRGNNGILNGKLKEAISLRNTDGTLYQVQKQSYNWSKETVEIIPNIVGNAAYKMCIYQDSHGYDNLYVGFYNFYAFKHKLMQEQTIAYLEPLALDGDESTVAKVITTVDYEYGALAGLPIKTTTTNSDGLQQIVKNYYPYQIADATSLNLNPALTTDELAAITNLKASNENRVGTPIQVETYHKEGTNAEVLLSAQRNLYKVEEGFTQLKGVYSSKRGEDFEERVVYTKYDTQGNPLELSKTDGTKVVYLWSTTHRKPLAMIVNASYAQVSGISGNLRVGLPNAQVTTYTYTGPLNLLSTVTDPRGYTTTYEYDELNRLKYVKDADGNILSANEYNYKQ